MTLAVRLRGWDGGGGGSLPTYNLRRADPLGKLVDVHQARARRAGGRPGRRDAVRLEWDGRVLDLDATPEEVGIGAGTAKAAAAAPAAADATLDLVDPAAVSWLRERAAAAGGGRIEVRVRTNAHRDGSRASVTSYPIGMGEAFERVVREYCRRNGVDAAACAFTFDGERLGQHLTPAQLELEGGEIIDVVIK